MGTANPVSIRREPAVHACMHGVLTRTSRSIVISRLRPELLHTCHLYSVQLVAGIEFGYLYAVTHVYYSTVVYSLRPGKAAHGDARVDRRKSGPPDSSFAIRIASTLLIVIVFCNISGVNHL